MIKKVVIAGGGTAGWLAAAALSRHLGKLLDITLIESDAISTVGVGEATIPPIRVFHSLLGIDEQQFMRATDATVKLGIAFEGWKNAGENYIHSFGKNGKETWLAEFHHFWLRAKERGMAKDFGQYCYELQAAKAGKFATSPQSEINYAYHLDAGLYAKLLRGFATSFGVQRVEGNITEVIQNTENGFIKALRLASGERVTGDLFIDCTGFRALLIEQCLQVGFNDWSHWLNCDSAVAVQTSLVGGIKPLTRAIAHEAGWRWQIPLQTRVGNGFVYSSRCVSEDEAVSKLLSSIEGETINEPRVIKYRTGHRRKFWSKNCVALGLSSGFVEPLESTSIHLIMMGITRLLQMFPFDGIQASMVEQYNDIAIDELEKIRDFLVLHYHLTDRNDSNFWQHYKQLEIPESLQHRIDLFKESAHAYQADGELFRVDSWVQVMLGQGMNPTNYHCVARSMKDEELNRFLASLENVIGQAVSSLPKHEDFLKKYCGVKSEKNFAVS